MKIVVAFLILSISVVVLIFGKSYFIDATEVNSVLKTRIAGKLNDEPNKLFWFLQISDIHVSKFKDPTRIEDFRKFTSQVVDVIRPRVVIASGDLTDAKDKILGSQQYAEEWKAYHDALSDNQIFEKTKWLDIRGNHDNFNVNHLGDVSDLYMNFSAQGKFHKRSFLHQEVADDVKYNFLALDASIEPGTKRPYNFIGIVPKDELERVEKMLNKSPGDFIIWFAHYPTSTIMTPSGIEHIRKFIGKHQESSIFVAGHLHTMGGFVKRMYTLQPEGFLELELGDFMKNRLFRVAAFDNGIFSFSDVKLGSWPIVVVTNPKDILFNNPFKEDIEQQRESTHIRILGFSTSKIVICKVKLNEESWIECEKKNENFFVVAWNPANYRYGKHKLEVILSDETGQSCHHEQIFALDGSRNSFGTMARFVLMNDLTTVFTVFFFMAFALNLTIMTFFKTWQLLLKNGKLSRPLITSNFLRNSVQKYLVFASVDKVFYGVLFWLIYTLVGPWSFHEVLDGQVGYYFVWGIFVNNEFIAATLNWWYGYHQLMFFQLPLMIIIAGVVNRRFKDYLRRHKDPSLVSVEAESLKCTFYKNLPFVALMLAEITLAILYIIQNGILSALIAPIRIWGIFYSLFLFYIAHWKISDNDLKELAAHVTLESKQAAS